MNKQEMPQLADAVPRFPLDKLEFKERTPLLRSIEGVYEIGEDVADFFNNMYNSKQTPAYNKAKSSAYHYIGLRKLGSRLPKFTKWAGSLFPKDKELLDYVALKSRGIKARKVIVSCQPDHILASGATNNSCLEYKGGTKEDRDTWSIRDYDHYQYVLPLICEKYSGVATALDLNADGTIAGRVFLAHAETEDKKPFVVAYFGYANMGTMVEPLLRAIKERHPTISVGIVGYNLPSKVKFVDCPPKDVHFDMCEIRDVSLKEIN